MKSRNPKIEFDRLQLYCGEPYIVKLPNMGGSIKMLQPTIGDIVRVGEKRFYQTLNTFIVNTTSYRYPLWKSGIDWNVLSDFELFIRLLPGCEQDILDLIFEDFVLEDLTLEKRVFDDDAEHLVIVNTKTKVCIHEDAYHHISQFFRNIFNMFPEEKLTKDNMLKQWMINADERELRNKEYKESRNEDVTNSMQAVISACINHPGFKYNMRELVKVGVCEFYDSVQRLQIYENSTAALKGVYSGMIDSKSINPETFNFMKEIK